MISSSASRSFSPHPGHRAPAVDGFLCFLERFLDLAQVAAFNGLLQRFQCLGGGGFLDGFLCVLDNGIHRILQDGVFLDLIHQGTRSVDHILHFLEGVLADIAVLDLLLQPLDQGAGFIHKVNGINGGLHGIHDLIVAFFQAVGNIILQVVQRLFQRFQLGLIQCAVLQIVPNAFNDLLGILGFDLLNGLFQLCKFCLQLCFLCAAVVQLAHRRIRSHISTDDLFISSSVISDGLLLSMVS